MNAILGFLIGEALARRAIGRAHDDKRIKRWIGAKKDRNPVKVRNVPIPWGVEVDESNFGPGSGLMRSWFTK